MVFERQWLKRLFGYVSLTSAWDIGAPISPARAKEGDGEVRCLGLAKTGFIVFKKRHKNTA